MPCVKDCCRPTSETIPFEILLRNAAVVGNESSPTVMKHPRCLPGIDLDRPITYRPYSAAAQREYAEDEGWQRVAYKKRKSRWRGRHQED